MKRHFLLGFMIVALSFPSSARAEEEAAPVTRWYGYQPLIADGVSIGLFVAAAGTATYGLGNRDLCWGSGDCQRDTSPTSADGSASTALLVSSLTTYAIAAPTIHAMHGHWDKAGASLGLRALPLAVGLPLALSSGPQNEETADVGAVVLLAGSITAMVVDDAFISRETRQRENPAAPCISVTPTFDARSGGGGGLALAGRF